MWFTLDSTASRRTAMASLSRGGPKKCRPASCGTPPVASRSAMCPQSEAAGETSLFNHFLLILQSNESGRFPDHFFAFFPERLGVFRVERITVHTFADHIIRHHFAHVAVLAILSADLVSRRHHRSPH